MIPDSGNDKPIISRDLSFSRPLLLPWIFLPLCIAMEQADAQAVSGLSFFDCNL
jgi:hypothetical protein